MNGNGISSPDRHQIPTRNIPLLPAIQIALNQAWAPATHHWYNGNIHEYMAFCDEQKVAEVDCLLASEMLLAMFTASLIGHIAGPTISAKISAIHTWHIRNNKPWQGCTLLQYILKGAANATPNSAMQTCWKCVQVLLQLTTSVVVVVWPSYTLNARFRRW